MQTNFDVDFIIHCQVCQVGKNVTDHDRKRLVGLKKFQHNLNDIQVLEFHKDVFIIVGQALHANKNTQLGVLV